MKYFLALLFLLTNRLEAAKISDGWEKDLTVVVSSCDKYSEFWTPCTTLLFRYWPQLEKSEVPIFLISNKEPFNHPRIQTIYTVDDISWSDNMLLTLQKVKTKYILFFIDSHG